MTSDSGSRGIVVLIWRYVARKTQYLTLLSAAGDSFHSNERALSDSPCEVERRLCNREKAGISNGIGMRTGGRTASVDALR